MGYDTLAVSDEVAILSLRKRIADNDAFLGWAARRFAGYVRWVHRSSDWRRIGFEPLDTLVEQGEAAIVVLWHQRLVMSPYMFPVDKAPICTITSSARAGSMAGRVQTLFGMETIAMSSHKRHVALSREVLAKIAAGISIGIAADGPRGPARQCSMVPLVWARASGKRVFVVTFAARNAARAGTWDRMLLPRPCTSGVILCREWARSVPRKAGAEQIETLRRDLETQLNDTTAEADQMVARPT